MAAITVPASFVHDFNYYCDRAGLNNAERGDLRMAIREDFETVGKHVSEMAATYRFCDEVWGYVPSAEICKGYLASLRWWAEDETIFTRWGPLLLARLCAEVAGKLPK